MSLTPPCSLTSHPGCLDSHTAPPEEYGRLLSPPPSPTSTPLLLATQWLQGLADGTDSLGNAASQIQISAQVCQVSPKEDSAISSVLTASRIPLICAPTMQRPMPSSFQLHSLPLISLRGAELVLISVSTISGVQNPILLPFHGSTFGVQLLWFLSWTLHTQNVS